MADYKRDRDEALRQYKDDLQRSNAEIMRMFEEKQGAGEAEKDRLEKEIAELKRREKRNMALLFAKIGGVALCSALAPFTGGLSTLALPIFHAFGGSGASGGDEATQDYAG
jgi:biopolymer transport protein ExbB/TolQ